MTQNLMQAHSSNN